MLPSEGNPSNPIAMQPEAGGNAADFTWVAADPHLKERATAAAETMGIEHLRDLIVTHTRFDHPSTIHNEDGTSRRANHYSLELLLGVVPDYMANAQQAGLSPGQAYDLVHTLLIAEGRSEWAMNDTPVVQLSHAFKYRAERSEVITEEDYAILHGLVADTASGEDRNVAVLDAYRALTRLAD